MKTFFVPYHIIKYMTLKQGNAFRHNLSWRLYLYLAHYKSGRMKWSERKELVETFKSSHTAIHKALAYLQEEGWLTMNAEWIQVHGERKVRKITLSKIGRNFNIEFEFNLNLLFDRKLFTNHLFTSIFQSSAMIRGKVNELDLIPQTKLNSDSVMLKGGLDSEMNPFSSVKTKEFIQPQSSTYLGRMTDRNPITIFNRNKQINQNWNGLRVRFIQTKYQQGLTENGFCPEVKSPLIASRDKSEMVEKLKKLQAIDPSLNSAFVKKTRYNAYIITKQPAHKYGYRIKTKSSYKKFDYRFEISNKIETVDLSIIEEIEPLVQYPDNFDPFSVELPF